MDAAWGPLGLLDHAQLAPGLLVPMHEHRNDEIVSYLRRGVLWHEDTEGGRLPLTADHIFVMNAGRGLWHEERVDESGEPVDMLQIFIRPESEGLPPGVQHARLPAPAGEGVWRVLVGPADGSAQAEPPATVRNRVGLFDALVSASGPPVATPSQPGWSGLLYLFSGEIEVEAVGPIHAGQALRLMDHPPVLVRGIRPSVVAYLAVDLEAKVSLEGTLSAGGS